VWMASEAPEFLAEIAAEDLTAPRPEFRLIAAPFDEEIGDAKKAFDPPSVRMAALQGGERLDRSHAGEEDFITLHGEGETILVETLGNRVLLGHLVPEIPRQDWKRDEHAATARPLARRPKHFGDAVGIHVSPSGSPLMRSARVAAVFFWVR